MDLTTFDGPMTRLPGLSFDAMLWLLGSLCNLHRIPFDAKLVAQDYPPPHDLGTLIDALRSLGFQAALSRVEGLDWSTAPLPTVAFLNALPSSAETASANAEIVIG